MISESDFILLNKYLDNLLSEKEKQELDNRLQSEENLQEEFKLLKSMNNFVQYQDDAQSVAQSIKEVAKKNKQPIPHRKNLFERLMEWLAESFQKYRVPALATFVVLVLAIPSIRSILQEQSLYDQHAPHYPVAINKGENDDKSIIKAHNEKNYKEVIRLFESGTESKEAEIQFAVGYSYLQENSFDKAETIYLKYIDHPTYKNKTYWNLALLHVKKEEHRQAQSYLNQISTESSYFSKVEKLLIDINKQ